jgi:divalent metal cation (Fe/Co/Zn/Cd) transporter
VIAGVGLAAITGWNWLDPAVAIGVALNILREGWRLVSRSVSGLMDGAWPDEDIRRMKETLARLQPPGAAFVNLRTRSSGADRFAFVELHVPPDWSVGRADGLAEAAERAVSGQGVALTVRVKPGSPA